MSSYERMGNMFTDAMRGPIEAALAPIVKALNPPDVPLSDYTPILDNLSTGSGIRPASDYLNLFGKAHAKLAGCSGQPSVGTTLVCDNVTALNAKLNDGFTCTNDDLEYSVTTKQAHHTGVFGTLRLTTFVNWYFEAYFPGGLLAAEKYFNKFATITDSPEAYLAHLCFFPAAGISFKQFYTESANQNINAEIDDTLFKDKNGINFSYCSAPIQCKGYKAEYKAKYALAVSQFEWMYTSYMYSKILTTCTGKNDLWDEDTLMAQISSSYKVAQALESLIQQPQTMTIKYQDSDFPAQDSIHLNNYSVVFNCNKSFTFSIALKDILPDEVRVEYRNQYFTVADAIRAMAQRIQLILIAQALLACVRLGKIQDPKYVLTDSDYGTIINPATNVFLIYDDKATAKAPADADGNIAPVFYEASHNDIEMFNQKFRDAKNVSTPVALPGESKDIAYYRAAPKTLTQFENKNVTGGGSASAQDIAKLKENAVKGSAIPLILGAAAAGLLLYSQNK